jgi:hypothetical protein
MINIKKRFNSYHKLGNLHLEDDKVFNSYYYKLNRKRQNLAKDHFLLTNAFGFTKLAKRINKGNEPLDYLNEPNEDNDKLNIFNYKKTFINKKGNHEIDTKHTKDENENLLQSLLFKMDKKSIENILKNQERKLRLQKKSLKGIIIRNRLPFFNIENEGLKTFNKDKSVKYAKNKNKEFIGFKTLPKLFSKISNETFLNSIRDNNKRKSKLIKNYSQGANKKIRDIFNSINSEEKIVEKNSRILNYNMHLNNDKTFLKTYRKLAKTIYSNSANDENFGRYRNISYIKNALKIKHKKDFEKILYVEDKAIFNEVKDKLHTLYKTRNKFK